MQYICMWFWWAAKDEVERVQRQSKGKSLREKWRWGQIEMARVSAKWVPANLDYSAWTNYSVCTYQTNTRLTGLHACTTHRLRPSVISCNLWPHSASKSTATSPYPENYRHYHRLLCFSHFFLYSGAPFSLTPLQRETGFRPDSTYILTWGAHIHRTRTVERSPWKRTCPEPFIFKQRNIFPENW